MNIGPRTMRITPNSAEMGSQPYQNETLEQSIVRLGREGLAIDQIARLVGAPQDVVAQVLGPRVDGGFGTTDFPLGFPGQGYRGRQLEQVMQRRQPDMTDMGIGSLTTDDDQLTNVVKQGFSTTDLVDDMLKLQITSPQAYRTEAETINSLRMAGVGLEDEDLDQLDAEDDLTKKVTMATIAGAAGAGQNDPNTRDTISTVDSINSYFSQNPEEMKEQLGVYKKAAEIFYDVSDIKKLVPEPDKSLPFLVAGAALIQSGEKGESWGSALSKAFLNYGITKSKEEKATQKQLTAIDMAREQGIQEFAASMYMADMKEKNAAVRALRNQDAQLYKIAGFPNAVPLTDSELLALRQLNPNSILGKWTDKDGVLKNFTLTDDNGNMMVKALTDAGAKQLQDSGKYAEIQVGNLLSGLKMYNVDGVNQMMLPQQAQEAQQAGKSIKTASGSAKFVEALNTKTNRVEFITPEQLTAQQNSGTNLYVPVQDNMTFAFDDKGMPIIGDSRFVLGILSQKDVSKIVKEFGDTYRTSSFNRDRVIGTIDEIRSVLESAEGMETPVFFGTAGALTKAGKRVVSEVNQLSKVFSGADKGWRFIKDDQPISYNKFKDGFGLTDYVDESGFGKFLTQSGLAKKEAENLIFQLALTSAMLEGQKGRDISDKDIERFLTRAGAYATSEAEFKTLLDNLEFSAIDYVDKLASNNVRLSPARMKNPEGDGTVGVLQYNFKDIIEEDENYAPTRGGETISQRRERLRDRRVIPAGQVTPREETPAGTASAILPGGNELSGYGNKTVHQVYEEAMADDNPIGYMRKVKDILNKGYPKGQNSPEFQAIKRYYNAKQNK